MSDNDLTVTFTVEAWYEGDLGLRQRIKRVLGHADEDDGVCLEFYPEGVRGLLAIVQKLQESGLWSDPYEPEIEFAH